MLPNEVLRPMRARWLFFEGECEGFLQQRIDNQWHGGSSKPR